jgi:hypothetical protein
MSKMVQSADALVYQTDSAGRRRRRAALIEWSHSPSTRRLDDGFGLASHF